MLRNKRIKEQMGENWTLKVYKKETNINVGSFRKPSKTIA